MAAGEAGGGGLRAGGHGLRALPARPATASARLRVGSSTCSHSSAATIPPRIGPTQYTMWATNWPATSAGPKARAGFIAAPVSGPPTRMSNQQHQAHRRTRRPWAPPALTQVPNTADTRKNVRIASSAIAWPSWMLLAIAGVPSAIGPVTPIGKIALTASAPRTAPMSCATM